MVSSLLFLMCTALSLASASTTAVPAGVGLGAGLARLLVECRCPPHQPTTMTLPN